MLRLDHGFRNCYHYDVTTFIDNKRALHNYEVIEEYEAGIELSGQEVKSVRGSHGSLAGSFVTLEGTNAFLVGATIPAYQPNNTKDAYDDRRARRLLLSKQEFRALTGTKVGRGLTVVPISMYSKGRFIKVRIALVRGKKKFDKRETIKKRDTDREIRRTLKRE